MLPFWIWNASEHCTIRKLDIEVLELHDDSEPCGVPHLFSVLLQKGARSFAGLNGAFENTLRMLRHWVTFEPFHIICAERSGSAAAPSARRCNRLLDNPATLFITSHPQAVPRCPIPVDPRRTSPSPRQRGISPASE